MAITAAGGAAQGTSTNASSVQTLPLTRAANATNNIFVVAAFSSLTSAAITISDTQANTWIPASLDFLDATNVTRSAVWYCFAKNTTSTTITITRAAGSGFTGMTLDEYTGTDTTMALDTADHSAVGASGTPTSPAVIPGINDALIWAVAVDSISGAGLIDGTNGTLGGADGSNDGTEFRVLTGRKSISMTAAFAGSGAYNVHVVVFRPPQTADAAVFAPFCTTI